MISCSVVFRPQVRGLSQIILQSVAFAPLVNDKEGLGLSCQSYLILNRKNKYMQKITPFLWFDGKAEEAAKFYTSLFKNSRITHLKHWEEGSPFPADQVMTVSFELDGVQFYAFDAGPQFRFTEAISLFVDCDTQEEVDHYWNALTADGGEESMCGWLKDRFGISWQIIPKALSKYLQSNDREEAGRVMQAMLKMRKIIIADLEKAAAS